jgi:hypothetical protein
LVGPTGRSVGLLVGRTHLSGTAMSPVGGVPGVPMSHTYLNLTFQKHTSSRIVAKGDVCLGHLGRDLRTTPYLRSYASSNQSRSAKRSSSLRT